MDAAREENTERYYLDTHIFHKRVAILALGDLWEHFDTRLQHDDAYL